MADTRITDAEIAGHMGWRGPGAHTEASLRKIRGIVDHVLRAERAAAPSPSTAPEVLVEHRGAGGAGAAENCRSSTAPEATTRKTGVVAEVDEREAFEAWASEHRYKWVAFNRLANGEYRHSGIEGDWITWLARAALASRPATVDDEGLPPLPPEAARAMKGEVAFFVKWQVAGKELRGSLLLFTAEQYRQGQRDAVAADRAQREKLPANAEEMVAFIGSHYNSMRDDKPDPNDIVYELTVHDLLSAFRWWFDDYDLEDEPSHTTNKENGQ